MELKTPYWESCMEEVIDSDQRALIEEMIDSR